MSLMFFFQSSKFESIERLGCRASGSFALLERHPQSGDRQLERSADGSPAQPALHSSLHLFTRPQVQHKLSRGKDLSLILIKTQLPHQI